MKRTVHLIDGRDALYIVSYDHRIDERGERHTVASSRATTSFSLKPSICMMMDLC